jgi:alkylation response protein AidB-like acyl-CoA dehydrogenase
MRWKSRGRIKASKWGAACSNRACASANPFPGLILAAVATAYCNELGLRVTSETIQVYGGYRFADEFSVSRFYRGAT